MSDFNSYDTSGDGVADLYEFDTNGDGYGDIAGMDRNQDGWYDGVAADTNLDGTYDVVGLDDDQDGVPQVAGADTDGDGFLDTIVVDANENGTDDSAEAALYPTTMTIGGGSYSTTGDAVVDKMMADHNAAMVGTWLETDPDRDGDGWSNSQDHRPSDPDRH